MGDSGAGKSTFNRILAHTIWEEYEHKRTIPLFISLPLLKDPTHYLISEHLKEEHRFSDDQIKELKDNRKFVFILDGYDEINKKDNLYINNKLGILVFTIRKNI